MVAFERLPVSTNEFKYDRLTAKCGFLPQRLMPVHMVHTVPLAALTKNNNLREGQLHAIMETCSELRANSHPSVSFSSLLCHIFPV